MVYATQNEKIIFIDTTSDVGKVCLGDDCLTWPAQGKVEVLVEKIDQLLKKHHLSISQINKIKVNRGPGSFTGTRVGVAVANALNWALKTGQTVKPVYHRPPAITKSP